MSAKKTDSDPASQPPLIIADPADGQMHAGTFDKRLAKTARRLARHYKCHVVGGDEAALSDLAARIMPGRIEDDRLMLASVPDDVAAELRKLLEPVPESDESDTAAEASDDIPTMAQDLRQADLDGLGSLSADELAALRTPEAEASGQPGEAGAQAPNEGSDRGQDLWDALAVGDVVLAADLDKKGEPECWFEAVIVRITPTSFILRFRDYPRDGLLSRTRRHVALLHPTS